MDHLLLTPLLLLRPRIQRIILSPNEGMEAYIFWSSRRTKRRGGRYVYTKGWSRRRKILHIEWLEFIAVSGWPSRVHTKRAHIRRQPFALVPLIMSTPWTFPVARPAYSDLNILNHRVHFCGETTIDPPLRLHLFRCWACIITATSPSFPADRISRS